MLEFPKVDIPANLGLHSEGPHEKGIIRARVHPTSSAFASCARARASVCTSKVKRTSIPVVIFQVAASMQIGRKTEKKKKKRKQSESEVASYSVRCWTGCMIFRADVGPLKSCDCCVHHVVAAMSNRRSWTAERPFVSIRRSPHRQTVRNRAKRTVTCLQESTGSAWRNYQTPHRALHSRR